MRRVSRWMGLSTMGACSVLGTCWCHGALVASLRSQRIGAVSLLCLNLEWKLKSCLRDISFGKNVWHVYTNGCSLSIFQTVRPIPGTIFTFFTYWSVSSQWFMTLIVSLTLSRALNYRLWKIQSSSESTSSSVCEVNWHEARNFGLCMSIPLMLWFCWFWCICMWLLIELSVLF